MSEMHLDAIQRHGTVLKGPIEIDPSAPKVELRGRSFTSANQALRKLFQLYANVRPAKALVGAPAPDLVVIRENTEGMYTGEEAWEEEGRSAVAIRRITREGTLRVARFAFDFARKHGRKKVTVARYLLQNHVFPGWSMIKWYISSLGCQKVNGEMCWHLTGTYPLAISLDPPSLL